MEDQNKTTRLNKEAQGLSPEDIIRLSAETFASKVIFASSLGEEDQIITDMIARTSLRIEIFTLDTGRLFPETYELIAKTQKRYPLTFRIYYPDTQKLEEMVRQKGINLFYDSVENRKFCCGIRKIEPLQRALTGFDAWICGLRRAQSVTRTGIKVFEWDEGNQKIKINPLADWSYEQVKDYIKEHQVDVNPLHAKGFVSIGCAPCTRAVKSGEEIRAGRWWWEQPEQKECGLHGRGKRTEDKK